MTDIKDSVRDDVGALAEYVAAKALATAVTADRAAVATDRATTVAKAGEADVDANAANAARLAAEATITTQAIYMDTLAGLQANTVALTGQVVADPNGANNGYYGRTIPNNPASAWVKKSDGTIPALTQKTSKITAYETEETQSKVAPLAVVTLAGREYTAFGVEMDTGRAVFAGSTSLASFEDTEAPTGVIPAFVGTFGGKRYSLLSFDAATGGAIYKTAFLNPQVVYDLGARGNVSEVTDIGSYYAYKTDALGGRPVQMFCRKDRPLHAHIVQRGTIVEAHIFIGQSWLSNSASTIAYYSGDSEKESVLAPHRTNASFPERTGPIAASSGISIGGTLDGVCGYSPDDEITIGVAAMIAYQRLVRRARLTEKPQLGIPAAYPGSTWTTGGGGGLQPSGVSWGNMVTMATFTNGMLPTDYGLSALYVSIHWVQGGSTAYGAYATDYDATIGDLGAMAAAFDALAYAGITTAPIYISQPSPTAATTTTNSNKQAQVDICRTNPRFLFTTPTYWWEFGDDIHGSGRAAVKQGERHALADFVKRGLGLPWNPFWRMTAPIRISGQVLTVPLELPRIEMFRKCPVVFDTIGRPNAGNYGIQVRRSGAPLTLTSIEIVPCRARVRADTNITLSGTQTIDGVAVVAGDRVLVIGQTAPSQNGVYVVAAGAWSRAADFDTWLEHVCASVTLTAGTAAGLTYICTVSHGGTLGTTSVLWMPEFDRQIPRYLEITISEALVSGNVLEFSTAWYGPGATMFSGCWSNLKVLGPPSEMFAGETLDLHIPHSREEFTVP